MAFAFASLVFAINPTEKTYAAVTVAQGNYQKAISAIKMPTKVDASKPGSEFRIPLLNTSFTGNTDYSIKVIDPAGQSHTYNSLTGASENSQGYFNDEHKDQKYITVVPLNDGLYDIIYIINDGADKFYSNKYTVKVTNVSYELNFTSQADENKGEKVVLPSAVKTGSGKIKLPIAYAKNTATEEVLTNKIYPVVRKNNITELDVDGENSPLTMGEDGYYYLNPTDSATYTIEYFYNQGSNPPKVTYEIEVKDDFEAPTELNITKPTLPSVQLGQKEIELPKLTVGDNISDNADYNSTITITKKGNTNITKTLPINTYEFDMTKEFFGLENYASMVGDYKVTYKIETAYLTREVSYTLKYVTDSTAPKVYMAYDYDIDETTKQPVGKVNTDYSVDFKANYGYNELVFPAIYAEDSVTDYKDFTFVRYIQKVNTSQIYYLDNIRMENGQLITVTDKDAGYNFAAKEEGNTVGQWNKAVTFKFKDGELSNENKDDFAGEYTLGYYVFANTVGKQENYVYETGTTRYRFKIVNATEAVGSPDVKVTEPKININNLKNNSSIGSDDELTVNVTSTDDADTRLKNAVYKFYGTNASLKTDVIDALTRLITDYDGNVTTDRKSNVLDSQAFLDEMLSKSYTAFTRLGINEDNEDEFDLVLNDFESNSTATEVTVLAITINDFGNVAIDTRVLKIKNLTDDEAPVYTKITFDDAHDWSTSVKTYTLGDDVLLPTVSFKDDIDESLAKNVVYYIDTPESDDIGIQYLSPSKQFEGNTIIGGNIKASKAGKYYVVYTATDDAGNTTSVYFTFVVEGVKENILTVDVTGEGVSKSGQTVNATLGKSVKFTPTVADTDLNEIADADIKYSVDDNGMNLHWETDGEDEYSLVFTDAGSYTVTFTAMDGEKELKKVIFVNVTRPELKWDKTPTVQQYAKKGEVVNLEMFSAREGEDGDKAKVTVQVTKPNGNVMADEEVKLVTIGEGADARQVWQFTTDEKANGTYKVVYTAKTANSTISTSAYSIRVGDNVKPTISIKYEKELKQNITYTGKDIEYKIELQRYNNSEAKEEINKTRHLIISVVSGDKTIYKYNLGLEITDMDDTGSTSTMSWSRLNVELTGDSSVLKKSDESTDNLTIYTISGKGEFTLKLSIADTNTNTQEKVIKFKVVEKTEVKEENDIAVGVALIIVSLVVLAGVILAFALTGKKSSSSKNKKSKKDNVKKVEETKVEENNEVTEEVIVEEENTDSTDNTTENE